MFKKMELYQIYKKGNYIECEKCSGEEFYCSVEFEFEIIRSITGFEVVGDMGEFVMLKQNCKNCGCSHKEIVVL